MVATKKSKTQPAPALRQSTLSFASKRAHSNKVDEKKRTRIRKTGSAPIPTPATDERVPAKRLKSPDPLEISSDSDETETERPEPKADKTTVPTPPAIEEIERERLNPKDRKWIKHYASVKQIMGGLPAVHGEKQTKIHEILRVFDLSYKYGPCVGTTRVERWQRAKALGLNPPIEVFEILSTKEGHEEQQYVQNVLYDEL